jgi:hypothetical protein
MSLPSEPLLVIHPVSHQDDKQEEEEEENEMIIGGRRPRIEKAADLKADETAVESSKENGQRGLVKETRRTLMRKRTMSNDDVETFVPVNKAERKARRERLNAIAMKKRAEDVAREETNLTAQRAPRSRSRVYGNEEGNGGKGEKSMSLNAAHYLCQRLVTSLSEKNTQVIKDVLGVLATYAAPTAATLKVSQLGKAVMLARHSFADDTIVAGRSTELIASWTAHVQSQARD